MLAGDLVKQLSPGKSEMSYACWTKQTCQSSQVPSPTRPHMIVFDLDEGAGTKKVPLPPERTYEPTLTEDMLKELRIVGLRIEAHCHGVHQDIEWAFCGGQLYILQTRRAKVA